MSSDTPPENETDENKPSTSKDTSNQKPTKSTAKNANDKNEKQSNGTDEHEIFYKILRSNLNSNLMETNTNCTQSKSEKDSELKITPESSVNQTLPQPTIYQRSATGIPAGVKRKIMEQKGSKRPFLGPKPGSNTGQTSYGINVPPQPQEQTSQGINVPPQPPQQTLQGTNVPPQPQEQTSQGINVPPHQSPYSRSYWPTYGVPSTYDNYLKAAAAQRQLWTPVICVRPENREAALEMLRQMSEPPTMAHSVVTPQMQQHQSSLPGMNMVGSSVEESSQGSNVAPRIDPRDLNSPTRDSPIRDSPTRDSQTGTGSRPNNEDNNAQDPQPSTSRQTPNNDSPGFQFKFTSNRPYNDNNDTQDSQGSSTRPNGSSLTMELNVGPNTTTLTLSQHRNVRLPSHSGPAQTTLNIEILPRGSTTNEPRGCQESANSDQDDDDDNFFTDEDSVGNQDTHINAGNSRASSTTNNRPENVETNDVDNHASTSNQNVESPIIQPSTSATQDTTVTNNNPPQPSTSTATSTNFSPESTCGVCLEKYGNKRLAATRCGHIFDLNCIQACIRRYGKLCPKCRTILLGRGYVELFF